LNDDEKRSEEPCASSGGRPSDRSWTASPEGAKAEATVAFRCCSEKYTLDYMQSPSKIIFFLFALVFLTSCGETKEYLPGELEYDKSVEAGETLIESIAAGDTTLAEACDHLSKHYDQGVAAFKRLMPSLKGLALQKRDLRLGALREFVEDNC
jgi:hypothetical protein